MPAHGYGGDRHVFGAVVPDRARVQAGVIRRMADAGDRRRSRCCRSLIFWSGPRWTSRRSPTRSGCS